MVRGGEKTHFPHTLCAYICICFSTHHTFLSPSRTEQAGPGRARPGRARQLPVWLQLSMCCTCESGDSALSLHKRACEDESHFCFGHISLESIKGQVLYQCPHYTSAPWTASAEVFLSFFKQRFRWLHLFISSFFLRSDFKLLIVLFPTPCSLSSPLRPNLFFFLSTTLSGINKLKVFFFFLLRWPFTCFTICCCDKLWKL